MFPVSIGTFHKFTRLGAFSLTIGIGFLLALGQPASAATVFLDFTDVAIQVNEGPVFNPASAPNLTITARGNIDPSKDNDPFAPSLVTDFTNTIVLSPSGDSKHPTRKGLGVQEPNGSSGTTGISGKGHEENEEVIFTFATAVVTSSIVIGISDICLSLSICSSKKLDDPILFLLDDQNNYERFDSAAIASVFEYVNDDPTTLMGTLSFAALLPGFTTITSFILRESDEEIYLTSYSGDVGVVPLPAGLPLFLTGLASLYYMRRRKRASA